MTAQWLYSARSVGVEPQSETVWHQADKYGVPKIAFINKMDRVGADFHKAVDMMRDRFRSVPLPIEIPMGKGRAVQGCHRFDQAKSHHLGSSHTGLDIYLAGYSLRSPANRSKGAGTVD